MKTKNMSAIRFSLVVLFLLSLTFLFTAKACKQTKLFESQFNGALGSVPAAAQAVGTAQVHGAAPGRVVIATPPGVTPAKWVQITRLATDGDVSSFQGNFSAAGDGNYTFWATVLIPSSGGALSTIQFEQAGQPVTNPVGFMHIDFMPDGKIRIDDDPSTIFGSYTKDQPFLVQVTFVINATSAKAHIVLAGAGASGVADRTIPAAFLFQARQFGAVRLWVGFPNSGKFYGTSIFVTKAK